MKKILTMLAIVLIAVGASAKKKNQKNNIILDFTASNPLTAVQGTTPEDVSLETPAYGITIPVKYAKDKESAESLGYIYCPNEEKGEEGWYLPYSKQSFQYDEKTYEMVLGSLRTPGRKANITYDRGKLNVAKPVFTFPKAAGKVPSGLKVYTLGNKYANERTVLRVCRNKVGSKSEITTTNAPEKGEDAVLECTFDGALPEDIIVVYSYAGFIIEKIEFLYSPVGK